jgi:hypothetical protein
MEIIHKKAAIQKALSAIGVKNGSSPPEHSDNRFGLAYELFVASELRSAANKRYDAAKAKAADAGVIDEEKTVEGNEVSTYVSKYFDVTMKKAASSVTLDKTMLRNHLNRMGIEDREIDTIIAASSKPRKGAVTIGFTLKG